ncbi:MAG: acetylxylan esterase, partial [Victivallaceae bacterium]|nr:acetylxylan esterase [Victivallaceae bacterium]
AAGKTATYSITRDGVSEITRGKITFSQTLSRIETVMSHPGFALLTVTCSDPDGRKIIARGGAGTTPLKIEPGFIAGEEFDRFWQEKKAELEQLPLKVEMKRVAVPKPLLGKVECFDVKVNCTGTKPVSGYLARPVNAPAHSLAAIVNYPGAGVYSANPAAACNRAAQGMLALDINAHGIKNGEPRQYYKDLASGDCKGYFYQGIDDREKCYFLGMLQRVYRSLQFIKSQPEWDGRHLIVRGSSQGGGMALAAAGMDPQVTLCIAFVPALCDHYGHLAGRSGGWPRLDSAMRRNTAVADAAKFFDCVNFARRIQAEAVLSAGFIDTTCCPSSVYAAYNSIRGRKQIINNPVCGHSNPQDTIRRTDAVIKAHIGQKGK